MGTTEPPVALWWGRFDPGYGRNRILRGLLAELGWRVADFRPHVSALGDLEYRLRGGGRVDLVWVPCFRQRDLAAGARVARRLGVPLVADPLVSAWDKQVLERGKFAPDSVRAQRLLRWEQTRLQAADRVLADTDAHARFFADAFGLAAARLAVVPVGAEEALFRPAPPAAGSPPEVLFFGSFIGLQAPQVIVEAARRYQGPAARWTLLGEGPLRAACEDAARGLDHVRFEPPVAYASLPARIHRAQVLLGVFGDSDKAARVIPNKVYQSLACARPVVTREAPAYPEAVRREQGGLHFVPPADADALAAAVGRLLAAPASLADEGGRAIAIYRRCFGNDRIRQALASLLGSLGFRPPARG